MICPHCHRTIHEEQRYLMSVDPERPGLLGSLRGDGGEAWRSFVTIAVCMLAVLLITGLSVAVRQLSTRAAQPATATLPTTGPKQPQPHLRAFRRRTRSPSLRLAVLLRAGGRRANRFRPPSTAAGSQDELVDFSQRSETSIATRRYGA